ncbi:tripartite ATP-independent transporter DctM subunit [Sulfuritortus calidifontis]|uniref:Tripartite ATP-independent transporter DctM subunit n=1 Tax=Sulfuritortus calidifontis TaxID=1914471 RepID=A0A4R3JUV7_9PROT|nr:TRAP transporter large permease subunit [Sulfuritortus calidifontis]TCS71694.1 tripartite ATP-independent transporter DctM subunit [Sulfuritortus calidifontis]
MKKELRFGFALMAIILAGIVVFMPWGEMTNGHMGLLMLALIVVAIMLGFPTAFTLMGMGVLFTWYAYDSVNPDIAVTQTLDLMVQRAYGVMTNDVLIAIPLFVFMGYLVERANLIKQLFTSIHLAMARIPGSLAVATLITCAVFATATGIVGAVVTLMGLLALPTMLRHGYDVRMTAGCITAGGCLGILIPPSVLLIVYGATAGVSVVQLYAGAFFPGLMLAALYIGYVIILAKLKPHMAPPLPMEERVVPLADWARTLSETVSNKALPALLGAFRGKRNQGITTGLIARHLVIVLLPAVTWFGAMGLIYREVTAAPEVVDTAGLVEMGMEAAAPAEPQAAGGAGPQAEGIQEPPEAEGVQEPPMAEGIQEPPVAEGVQEPATELGVQEPPQALAEPAPPEAAPAAAEAPATPVEAALNAPTWYWVVLAAGTLALAVFYGLLNFARLEIFKMLLSSFFPLSILILAVLGSIVFGLATPTEAAAVGALGGFILAALYKQLNFGVLKESVFLTAKTSAMVCWLFVGSSIFSAAFALLGGQELVEKWVLSLDLTPVQFLLLSQVIIFILGWPLEWTEIIVIFMPIFIPLLAHFNIDPLFFGLLVALNLQTAFLSPPVAMAAFYLKGVSPPHVTLNQIFAGMMPFMGIQIIAMALLYIWPQIGMWLPTVLYR